MKKIVFIIAILCSLFVEAQENYKYVIIPNQFSFLNDPNKYNLNTLTKSFFESEGFTVFYDNEDLPKEIANNRCNALYANAVENNSLFLTKVKIEIKDCQNKTLLTSLEASSKEKSFDKAYTYVFREALTSLKGKIKNVSNIKSDSDNNKMVVVEEVPVLSENKVIESNKSQLFALPSENGFKLVDAVPNVKFELRKTTIENVYLAEKDMVEKGIFYKKNDVWYFESYKSGKLVTERIEVKF